MKKKILIATAITLLVVIVIAVIFYYPTYRAVTKKATKTVDPGLTLMLGGGGNTGIIVGEKAVLVIDTKLMGASEGVYKQAKALAGLKPIIVVNTHYHPDHVGGNRYFQGCRIYIGGYEREFIDKNVSPEDQPTDFVKDSLSIDLGNEQAHLYNLGRAHTYDDLVVFLPRLNVLFTGDIVFHGMNPVLKEESGANVASWINALDTLLARWGNARIVPGHGNVGHKELMLDMRQYFVDMTTAARDPKRRAELTAKYADWVTVPGMASPATTIEFILKGNAH